MLAIMRKGLYEIIDLVNILMFAGVCSGTNTGGEIKERKLVRNEGVATDRGE